MQRLIATTLPYLLTAMSCASLCEQPSKLRRYVAKDRVPQVLACMEEEESWIREETALALGGAPSEASRARLEKAVQDRSERPWVRAAAADALGRIKHPGSKEILAGLLVEPGIGSETKLALIEAVCAYGPSTLQAIAPLTQDEDVIVSALAARKVKTQCAR